MNLNLNVESPDLVFDDNVCSMRNLGHTALVQFANAFEADDVLKGWIKSQKVKVPSPVLLARFPEGQFSNQRFEALLDLGFDNCVIGRPPGSLIDKMCAKIKNNNDTIVISPKYGRLILRETVFYRNDLKIKLTYREAAMLRMLLDACGKYVTNAQFRAAFGLNEKVISHAVQTHFSRLRLRLNEVGMEDAITNKIKIGYRLER